MKIKRYTAESMRAALALVRAEQGPDAVIMSSRRGEDGIEVIAAVDYDEALFVEANRQRIAASAPQSTAEAASVPAPVPAPVSAAARPAAAQAPASVAAPRPAAAQAPVSVAAPRPAAAQAPVSAATARPAAVPAPVSAATVRPAAAPAPLSAAIAASAGASVPAAPAAPAGARAAASATSVAPVIARASASAAVAAPAARASASAAPPTARAAAAATAPAAARTAVPSPARHSAAPPAAAPPDLALGAMQRELRDLRQLVQTGFAEMTWNDKRLREPLKAEVFDELSAMDIAPDVAMSLAALTPLATHSHNRALIPLALLVKHLPVVDHPGGVSGVSGVSGGIMAVVGPTGAGKTTTIAKLAARWCMHHGSQDLALVSTDGYRIGAREQLTTYARILGAPMHTANSGMELARVLERLKSKKLILIDTAGMGPRDVRMTEQLAALQLGAARARIMLALPAQGEGQALEEILQAFVRVAPAACIVTKVDEAASLGAVISTTLRHKLKIAYICDGQRVPEDLHPAHQKRVWLVRAALNLKSHAPPRDRAFDGRHFGGAHAHA